MDLSIAEVAVILGLSARQVRNLVKDGKIEARKVGGQWVVAEEKVPRGDRQRHQQAARAGELKEVVEQSLSAHTAPRYTVRSLHAFTAATTASREARLLLGSHPAVDSLVACCLSLSRGAHAFRERPKLQSFAEARDHAADAVAWLYLEGRPEAVLIGEQVEAEVLQGISGLIRRQERGARL